MSASSPTVNAVWTCMRTVTTRSRGITTENYVVSGFSRIETLPRDFLGRSPREMPLVLVSFDGDFQTGARASVSPTAFMSEA